MELWKFYEKSKVYRKGGGLSKEKASLFVCGILLRELLFPELRIRAPKSNYTFEQMWYLICLHHDRQLEKKEAWVCACREMNEIQNVSEAESEGRESLLSWSPMRLRYLPQFHFGTEGICFSDGSRVRESLLSEEDINDAFHFRSACSHKMGMEHGMAGGLLLYENLCKNREREKGKLSPGDVALYSYLANVLIVHHLWEDRREEKCREENQIKDNPLLCLLYLAEAMEPLHASGEQYTEKEVLRGTQLDVLEGGFVLRPDQRCIDFKVYAKKLALCAQMTGVNCKIEEETGEITIKMCESPIIDELFI